jgi:hypothetical protein
VSEADVGFVLADIGDLREAIDRIEAAYSQIGKGAEPEPLLDEIESEARDHMPGHIKSLRRTVGKVRKDLG